jgi:hypothetical protein
MEWVQASVCAGSVLPRQMSLMGLGCVKTFAGDADVKSSGRAERAWDYALIAAMRGWIPIMFITRVRL